MVDILLVEDNAELSRLMSAFIVKRGYTVFCVESGEAAIDFMSQENCRLMLLDILLPGIDGFTVCRKVREQGSIPIIILSARVDKEDKMHGFTLGADDYVEKPVDIDILCAKIDALFKRYYGVEENKSLIRSNDLTVNQDKMQVTFRDKVLSLTIKEYDLLLLFIENKGRTLNKDYIFSMIWGADSDSENQTLTVHIKMLRDKIEDDPKHPKKIVTVWGIGYRYEET